MSGNGSSANGKGRRGKKVKATAKAEAKAVTEAVVATAEAAPDRPPVNPDANPVLSCNEVMKRFGGIAAVDHVDLHVQPGEIVGLIGHNGAGKTTLMDCISGFLTVDGGRIQLRGVDITDWAPHERARSGHGDPGDLPRMRVYRKRRRQGLRYVRIPLCVTEIDDLIRMGLLTQDQRHDHEALHTAILGIVYRALEGLA